MLERKWLRDNIAYFQEKECKIKRVSLNETDSFLQTSLIL